MNKLKMHSPNLTDGNIDRIRELFPACVTEAHDEHGTLKLAVDFDQLKQELSDSIVEGPQERYHLNWPGKREALLTANAPIAKTLRPCLEESVDFDTTKNLFIEGDNLDALKLLQETYLGKVKMIYIDPPYNTGNDFIYEDDFAENSDEFLLRSNQKDEEGNRLIANTESNGRFHSDWLSMIYPRLKLARNLLRDDGVIFISIDDNEVHNLRKICDEIFGENNFVDCLKWKRKKQPSFLAKHTAKVMEYVLVYGKVMGCLEKLSISGTSDATKKVINVSNKECLRHFKKGVRVKIEGVGIIPAGRYTVKTMDVEYLQDVHYSNGKTVNEVEVISRFSVKQESIDQYIDDGLLFITAQKGLRRDVSEEDIGKRKSITDLLLDDWGDNQESEKELIEIFGSGKYFEYIKSIKLVSNLVKSCYSEGSIILDFFAGSSTTAHAIMQLNAEDGGNRKFIMVQLPEPCNEQSEAFKAGYKTIAEISKERIRRAGKKIKDEREQTATGQGVLQYAPTHLDTGFRVLKIDSSNMAEVYYTPDAVKQEELFNAVDNIKPDRTPEDLLFQILLDLSVDLSLPIRKELIQGKTVFFVHQPPYDLIACFDTGVSEELVKELAQHKPLRVVFRDTGFVSDTVKINVDQIFKQLSPGTEVKSI